MIQRIVGLAIGSLLVVACAKSGEGAKAPSDAEHALHADHAHVHGDNCGHKAIAHEGHTDYEHDGHLHAMHDGHVDEHGVVATP
jgi:zinc transport system permease protein